MAQGVILTYELVRSALTEWGIRNTQGAILRILIPRADEVSAVEGAIQLLNTCLTNPPADLSQPDADALCSCVEGSALSPLLTHGLLWHSDAVESLSAATQKALQRTGVPMAMYGSAFEIAPVNPDPGDNYATNVLGSSAYTPGQRIAMPPVTINIDKAQAAIFGRHTYNRRGGVKSGVEELRNLLPAQGMGAGLIAERSADPPLPRSHSRASGRSATRMHTPRYVPQTPSSALAPEASQEYMETVNRTANSSELEEINVPLDDTEGEVLLRVITPGHSAGRSTYDREASTSGLIKLTSVQNEQSQDEDEDEDAPPDDTEDIPLLVTENLTMRAYIADVVNNRGAPIYYAGLPRLSSIAFVPTYMRPNPLQYLAEEHHMVEPEHDAASTLRRRPVESALPAAHGRVPPIFVTPLEISEPRPGYVYVPILSLSAIHVASVYHDMGGGWGILSVGSKRYRCTLTKLRGSAAQNAHVLNGIMIRLSIDSPYVLHAGPCFIFERPHDSPPSGEAGTLSTFILILYEPWRDLWKSTNPAGVSMTTYVKQLLVGLSEMHDRQLAPLDVDLDHMLVVPSLTARCGDRVVFAVTSFVTTPTTQEKQASVVKLGQAFSARYSTAARAKNQKFLQMLNGDTDLSAIVHKYTNEDERSPRPLNASLTAPTGLHCTFHLYDNTVLCMTSRLRIARQLLDSTSKTAQNARDTNTARRIARVQADCCEVGSVPPHPAPVHRMPEREAHLDLNRFALSATPEALKGEMCLSAPHAMVNGRVLKATQPVGRSSYVLGGDDCLRLTLPPNNVASQYSKLMECGLSAYICPVYAVLQGPLDAVVTTRPGSPIWREHVPREDLPYAFAQLTAGIAFLTSKNFYTELKLTNAYCYAYKSYWWQCNPPVATTPALRPTDPSSKEKAIIPPMNGKALLEMVEKTLGGDAKEAQENFGNIISDTSWATKVNNGEYRSILDNPLMVTYMRTTRPLMHTIMHDIEALTVILPYHGSVGETSTQIYMPSARRNSTHQDPVH
ncbi:ORF69 [Ranid herpesvirus 1]|uniref:ORF69 n=1 Tax=Ranid herpesvirus 1 TaxID=85655 RepID=Q9YQZ9_9VIRU|nr:ORF69 [Ranid herpesvirus 1]AAD12266.1 ORF69 [Ranid herpesvirus 1]